MLILASASPRRRELLAQAGYTFAVEAADVDESRREGEEAGVYVRRLAEEKARVVLGRHPTHDDGTVMNGALNDGGSLVVLGADTCVVCDGEILGKPVDAADAMRMLRMLSGRTHEVLTGVAVVTRAGGVSDVETTEVTFSEMPQAELVAYCATGEQMDKAGAYGIQGYAARWIPRIDGCYFNVMGLPIARTVRLIEDAASGLGRE
jgi:septum formation protein